MNSRLLLGLSTEDGPLARSGWDSLLPQGERLLKGVLGFSSVKTKVDFRPPAEPDLRIVGRRLCRRNIRFNTGI